MRYLILVLISIRNPPIFSKSEMSINVSRLIRRRFQCDKIFATPLDPILLDIESFQSDASSSFGQEIGKMEGHFLHLITLFCCCPQTII